MVFILTPYGEWRIYRYELNFFRNSKAEIKKATNVAVFCTASY